MTKKHSTFLHDITRSRLYPFKDDVERMADNGASSRDIANKYGVSYMTALYFVRACGFKRPPSAKERSAKFEHIVFEGRTYTYRDRSWMCTVDPHTALTRDAWRHFHPDDPILKGECVVVKDGDIRDPYNAVYEKITIAELNRRQFRPDEDTRLFYKALSMAHLAEVRESLKHDPEKLADIQRRRSATWESKKDAIVSKIAETRARKLAEDPDYFKKISEKVNATKRKRGESDPGYFDRIYRGIRKHAFGTKKD